MIGLTRVTLLAGALMLGACTNPDGFGGGPFSNPGSSSSLDGDPSDQTSTAYFQQTVGDRVLFEVDQSTLTEDARLVLLSQANWLLANGDYEVIVEGHADEQGTREYNLALGARRANAVKEYLLSKGVSGDRLRTVTFGKERPIEVCSAEACYSENRRAVSILSVPGLSS